MDFLSDDGGQEYNHVRRRPSQLRPDCAQADRPSMPSQCHFWSNFEIGDLDFWRGEAYSAYFDHLEAAGGFYYERWGDAPVHSIGASLFAVRRVKQFPFLNSPGSSRPLSPLPAAQGQDPFLLGYRVLSRSLFALPYR
jgi:alpha 1,2-mannosyltransferase